MGATLLAELGIVCTHCDAWNDPGKGACADCGKPLPGITPAAPAPSKPVSAPTPAAFSPPSAVRPAAPPPPAVQAQPVAPAPAPRPTAPPASAQPSVKPTPSPFAAPQPPAPAFRPPMPVAPATPAPMPPPGMAPPAGFRPPPGVPVPAPLNMPAATPVPRPPSAPALAQHRIVVIRGTVQNAIFKLPQGSVGAGRSKGLLLFPEDAYLAPLHATFFYREGRLFVRDEGSPSGTFVRIQRAESLQPGALFAAGDRLLRYAGAVPLPPPASPVPYGAPAPNAILYVVEDILEGGRPGRSCARAGPIIGVGRTGCELSFQNDASLQPRHCEVLIENGQATLRDLGSSDGTFVRLPPGGERQLAPGDVVRFGREVLRIEQA